MKFMANDRLLPGATPEKIMPLMRDEAAHGWELYKQGVFREMYFKTGEVPGAVLIMECESEEEARSHLDKLPLVVAGLVDFDIYPLGYFKPLEALLAKD